MMQLIVSWNNTRKFLDSPIETALSSLRERNTVYSSYKESLEPVILARQYLDGLFSYIKFPRAS